MKFGLFYELQLPRPWEPGDEQKLIVDSLDQVELADKVGIDYVWEVEHHFLEEYSHSSAPEVFLGACSQRTKNIRLGHGIMHMPPMFNHPARAAERIAMLDLVSQGRVDFGTGESAAHMELGGFNIPPEEKHAMWREAVEQAANMLVMTPYPGFQGKYFSMPCRNLVPKPAQQPHPPMWMACSSRRAVQLAAKLGLGALTFAFIGLEEAKRSVEDYYRIFESECEPIAHRVNPNIAIVTGFACHPDRDEAIRRGEDAFRFFGFSLGYYYAFGDHKPGRSNIWETYEAARPTLPSASDRCAIGTPEEVRNYLLEYEAAGVDQVILIQQGGKNRHEDICESIDIFAKQVMPEFKEREFSRAREKEARLAAACDAAMSRKVKMPALADKDIPTFRAGKGRK